MSAESPRSSEWFAANAEETIVVGAEIARQLQPGTIVLLEGTLGAGKTTLMKGIVEALGAGVREDVTSPTFTLVHEYASPQLHIFHLDVYRMQDARELDSIGFDEMCADPAALVLVEWGLKFQSLTRQAHQVIYLEHQDDGRHIRLTRAPNGNFARS